MPKKKTKITLTSPKDIIYPLDHITKKAVFSYYEKISPYILHHAKNRPITIERFTDSIAKPGFYQKEIPGYFPAWLTRIMVRLKTEKRSEKMALLKNPDDLLYLVNQRALVFHAWLSSIDKLKNPDKIIFDLDPSGSSQKKLVPAALALKKILEKSDLVPFIMATGSRGYHVVAPIRPDHDFATVHAWAKTIAQSLAQQHPTEYTIEMSKKKRGDRVFIDYLRNSYGQTGVVPYSLRALPGAPVATPLTWSELQEKGMHPQKFNMKNIFRRLKVKGDPWKNFSKSTKRLKISTFSSRA